MHDEALTHLRCPVCHAPFTAATGSLRCPAGHSFDVAREGYVNLLAGAGRRPRPGGDTAAMVAARAGFLAAGHYRFIADALVGVAARLAGPAAGGLVLEVGAGTGYHLAAVLDARPGAAGLAVDTSVPAARRAARAHPRAASVVADAWVRLPVADRSATLLLDVFAPRHGAEFHRVLRPDGVLLVVTPAAEHLAPLVDELDLLRVDPAKPDRLAGTLSGRFTPVEERPHRRTLRLAHPDVRALVLMGPSARHRDPADLDRRLSTLPDPVEVTAAVRVTAYRPR